MNQVAKAARFAALHVKGAPLLLYNAWDAGTAKSILDAGAKAIATSSWAVAEAQGYRDGETIPITLVEQIIAAHRKHDRCTCVRRLRRGLQRRQRCTGRKRGPPP
jgi:2-methylisocitrate lyase-like PEP mutase family enzyme